MAARSAVVVPVIMPVIMAMIVFRRLGSDGGHRGQSGRRTQCRDEVPTFHRALAPSLAHPVGILPLRRR